MLALLSGCAATLPPEPPRDLYAPAQRIEPFVPNVPDLDPKTAKTVSLDDLLAFADVHAPRLSVARSHVGLADAAIVEADTSFPDNPSLELAAGLRSVGNGSALDLDIGLSQEFEVAGEASLRRETAQKEREVTLATLNEVRWAIHVEVHRLYVHLLLTAERQTLAEQFVAFAKKLQTTAVSQVDAGESSPLILLVADADVAQSREVLVDATQESHALRVRIAALIGWPDTLIPPIDGAPPGIRKAPDLSALLDKMATHHPALRTREIAVLAARQKALMEAREGWPKPTIGLSYTLEGAPDGGPEANIWMFGLSLPLTIWQTNQGGQARANAALETQLKARDLSAIELRGQVIEAASALDSAAERTALYEETVVPRLQENLALLQRAYTLGEVDIHQVSQTRERLLEATSNYLAAREAYHEAAAVLEGLIGTEIWPSKEASP